MEPSSTFILGIIREIGPLGCVVVICVMYYLNDQKHKESKNSAEIKIASVQDAQNEQYIKHIEAFQKSVDEIKSSIQEILIAQETKVPYPWIETELKNYARKDILDIEVKRFMESLRAQGERIGKLEQICDTCRNGRAAKP